MKPIPPDPVLYLIATCKGALPDHVDLVTNVVRAGVGMIQMREKDAGRAERRRIGRALRDVASREGVPFVVNDDPILARELGADGVHLGQEDITLREARAIVGEETWIGLSTHDTAQIRAAAHAGITMIGVGPIFETTTKRHAGPPVGVGLVRQAARLAPDLPAFAIGGITGDNADLLVRAGCRRIAVSSWILEAADPVERTARLATILDGRRP